MLQFGQEVEITYEDGNYPATLVDYYKLPQNIQSLMFNQLITRQITFTVRFKEGNEYSYDIVTLDQLKIDQPIPNTLLGNQIPSLITNCISYGISSFPANNQLVEEITQDRNEKFPFLNNFPLAPSNLAPNFHGNTYQGDFCGFVDSALNIVQLDQFCTSKLQQNSVFQLQRIVKIKAPDGQTVILACGVSCNDNVEFPVIYPLETVVSVNTRFNVKFQAILHQNLAYNQQLDSLIEEEQQLPIITDLSLGLNYQWLDGLQLKKSNFTLTPATPLEVLTADFWFIQGKIVDNKGQIIKSKPQKLNVNAHYCYQICENYSFSDQFPVYEKFVEMLRGEGLLVENKLTVDNKNLGKITTKCTENQVIRCGFCGKTINEQIVGPFLYSLIQSNSAIGQSILVAFHHNCAMYVPEVAEFAKEEQFSEEIVVDFEAPWQINYCVIDRVFRKSLILSETVIYQFLRKALKQDRMNNKCAICQQYGAVIGCWDTSCAFTAHYDCILATGLSFKEDKKVYCKKHNK